MAENTEISIAESFYTLQGEGRTVGTPSVFLRTGGCNLLCGAVENPDDPQEELVQGDNATWTCDTISVWRNPNTYTVSEIIDHFEENEWLEHLENGAHLILTGGEPMLRQDELVDLLEELPDVTVEVETNGTIEPKEEFDDYIDYYNVSLKLSNSGMPEDRRLVDSAIKSLKENNKTMFKIVVSREKDLQELWDIQDQYDIDNTDVQLMPAGYTRNDLSDTYQSVAELCKDHGYRFTPRLHVELWNTATGV